MNKVHTFSLSSIVNLPGQSPEDAWNNNMVQIIDAARPHAFLLLARHGYQAVDDGPKPLQHVMRKVVDLFALFHLKKMSNYFLEFGYMNKEQTQLISTQVITLCKEMRKVR